MCGAVAIGVAQAGMGIMSSMASHKEAQRAAARQNQVNQQAYQRNLQIARNNDEMKKKAYEGQLNAQAEAVAAYNKELAINQVEADRAGNEARQKKQEKNTAAAFEIEKQIATAIQAQGKMLSTGASGQSFLLQTLQAERELGLAGAQLDQGLQDAHTAYARDLQGVALDHHSADAADYNRLPTSPLAQQASWIPNKPIKVKGPSQMSLLANIGTSIVGGVATGYGIDQQQQLIDKPVN